MVEKIFFILRWLTQSNHDTLQFTGITVSHDVRQHTLVYTQKKGKRKKQIKKNRNLIASNTANGQQLQRQETKHKLYWKWLFIHLMSAYFKLEQSPAFGFE